ncbi:putative membrane protein [Candidatus Ichthyocystis hellenicum]|uniref:Putative membrane protein n=1 Tax=Candidatus Ichthyocystis hellenicum TaxID=1561003 RepID=A0A0S4M4A7_9BURK|nr:hypothetical protein [Candidatus Ichthyocystis hellenicum]CUT17546.1 putative membrane protein [Candidatus Ichthyocystis hellenicum]
MQGCLVAGDVLENKWECYCDVCCSCFAERVMPSECNICERVGSLFSSSDADITTYVSDLKLENDQDLEIIKEMAGLELLGSNRVVLKCPISPADKFMVAFALFLVVVIIVFMIFAVLMCKGVIHISGVSSEMMSNITKWVGVGLCMASLSYSMLGLGYLIRGRVDSNEKRGKSNLDCYESKLKKCAGIQKEADSGVRACFGLMKSSILALRLASIFSNERRYKRLSSLRQNLCHIKEGCQ